MEIQSKNFRQKGFFFLGYVLGCYFKDDLKPFAIT